MKTYFQLPETIDRTAARHFQLELGKQVLIEPLVDISTVAGLDAAYDGDISWGAAVLTDADGLPIQTATAGPIETHFPYLLGYFGFREAPSVVAAVQKLNEIPSCLILDGHGIWHPRACGLATMVGLLFDIPTIGCAKTPLDENWTHPARERGAWTSIEINDELVGATVRTRDGVKPVWVSPGHRCDVPTAVDLVLRLTRTRLPEPLRLADRAATKAAKCLPVR